MTMLQPHNSPAILAFTIFILAMAMALIGAAYYRDTICDWNAKAPSYHCGVQK